MDCAAPLATAIRSAFPVAVKVERKAQICSGQFPVCGRFAGGYGADRRDHDTLGLAMGGMDWYCRFDARDGPVVDAMRAAGRRRARTLNLRWSSSVEEDVCGVIVDGGWWAIDLLIARLARDLPTICEAISLDHRGPSERRGLGRSFAHIAAQHRFGEPDFHPEDWLPRLVNRSAPPWDATVFGFGAPNAPDLEARLDVTARMMVDWEFEEVAPEVLLEELHTAAELCLKRALWGHFKRQGSFAENVELADERDLLLLPDVRLNRWSLRAREHDKTTTVKDLLLSLKDARKVARHEARDTAYAWLQEWVVAAGEVLEVLAGQAWTKDGPGDPDSGIEL